MKISEVTVRRYDAGVAVPDLSTGRETLIVEIRTDEGHSGLGFVYRYAPWFALAWVPFTYLPREAVLLVWQILMLAAGLTLLWPLLRPRA